MRGLNELNQEHDQELKTFKVAVKLFDKHSRIPTIKEIIKECKGDNNLVGKVHLCFINEILKIHLEQSYAN